MLWIVETATWMSVCYKCLSLLRFAYFVEILKYASTWGLFCFSLDWQSSMTNYICDRRNRWHYLNNREFDENRRQRNESTTFQSQKWSVCSYRSVQHSIIDRRWATDSIVRTLTIRITTIIFYCLNELH